MVGRRPAGHRRRCPVDEDAELGVGPPGRRSLMAAAGAGDGQTSQVAPERSRPVRSPGPGAPGRRRAAGRSRRRSRAARRPGTRRSAWARGGPVRQPGQHEGQPGLVAGLVVDEDRVLADVGHVDDAGPALAVERPRPCASSAPKRIGWPCTSGISMSSRFSLAVMRLEGAVVEDVAVLVDLDEGRALVVVGPAEHLHHVLAVHVVGAGHEVASAPRARLIGLNGVVERAERRRLGDLARPRWSASTGPWSARRSGC